MGLLEDPNLINKIFFILPWKGYHTEEQIKKFADLLSNFPDPSSLAYLLAVPLPYLKSLSEKIQNPAVFFGSSTMNSASPGSFSESIAAKVIQNNRGQFALIGTAESRQKSSETASEINDKIKAALKADLSPFLCFGETLEEFEQGKSAEVVSKQIKEAFSGLSAHEIIKVALVYEAPWAQKTLEQLSSEKLMQSYFNYRQAIAEVLGVEVFSQMKLIDLFPSDLIDLTGLLQTIRGKGIYTTDPQWLLKILEIKDSKGIRLTQNEERPPLPIKNEHTPLEQPIATPSEKHAETAPSTSKIEQKEPPFVEIKKENNFLKKPVEQPKAAPPTSQIKEEEPSVKELKRAEKPSKEIVSSSIREEQGPLAEAKQENSEELPKEKKTMPLPSSENSFTEEENEPPKTPENSAPLDFPEPEDDVSSPTTGKSELQTRLNLLASLNESLAECYQEIRTKGELLPKLRDQFPEQLTKMTADLNKLDPELQEHINRGNVNFFAENPEKAKEASGVLTQLRELNVLLHETAAIPRDIDRLTSKGRKLRKELETEWEYFRTHKKELKLANPDFELPPNPSQLLIKEPIVDLTPKDSGSSSLTSKRVAVVKTPPTK